MRRRLATVLACSVMAVLTGCDIAVKPPPRRVQKAPPKVNVEGRVSLDDVLGTKTEKHAGDLRAYIVEAKASTVQGRRMPAEFAFDGNLKTRWSSKWEDGQWLEGYFAEAVAIKEITIHWETARASSFGVSLMNSRSEWIELARYGGATGDRDTVPLARPMRAWGVRITCDERATEWGNSIFEIEITGTADGPPPAENFIGFEVPPDEWEKREREIAERLMGEAAADPIDSSGLGDDAFLDLVSRRAFDYFWWESHPETGLTKDRARNFASSEEANAASVAAVGYALTAYTIGVERGWVSRKDALERTRATLSTFTTGLVRNARGMFPHFVNLHTGADMPGTEVSTIDTALLLAGAIIAKEYFNDPDVNVGVQQLIDQADWRWARHNHELFVSHGLDNAGNFLFSHWGSMTEGLLIYLLALGSETHALTAKSWYAIDRTLGEESGYLFLIENASQTMFPFHYPALWYDFRGRVDQKGVNYFENATRSALAMRAYCIGQAAQFPASYGPRRWGVSPADGPGNGYKIYGYPPGTPGAPTDGTIVIHAIGGAMPFIPGHAIQALRTLYDEHHETWGKYGFTDSLNPTLGFVARDAIGLDTGTVLIGIENYRSQFVWNLFMQNRWIQKADRKIQWRRRPRPEDKAGPVDLARQATWRLTTGGGNQSAPSLDDTQWHEAVVPDRWENLGHPFADHDGPAWYRATFGLDGDRLKEWVATGRPIHLLMGGVDDFDVTYVNGVKVGQTRAAKESFNVPRRYPVPAKALRPGRNVVAVHVIDKQGNGGIWLGPVLLGP